MFARLRGDAEAEHPGPGLGDGEVDPYRGRLAVGGELHLARPDDPAGVFHEDGGLGAAVAVLPDQHVHHQRCAEQDGAGSVHPRDLDVLVEALATQAHGEYRNARPLQGQQRFGDAGARVVGAVAQDHQARDREAGELLARGLERLPQPAFAAGEMHLRRLGRPLGGGGEAEETELEPVGQGLEQRGIRPAEGLRHEGAPGRAVLVGDLHALRIVDQHPQEVPLGHDGREHQLGAEEAEENHREYDAADGAQDGAVLPTTLAPDARVAEG